jgi:hypothetical protein
MKYRHAKGKNAAGIHADKDTSAQLTVLSSANKSMLNESEPCYNLAILLSRIESSILPTANCGSGGRACSVAGEPADSLMKVRIKIDCCLPGIS